MKILGIDPGVADTGWAVLEQDPPGGAVRLLASGIVRTAPPTALPERLHAIHGELSDLLRDHRPDAVAIEEMFFLKRANTMRATLQARGVILLAAAQAKTQVVEYNPKQVKATLAGSGAAEKAQMQKMVQRTLGLAEPLRPDDTADAAAIALCHLRSSRYKSLKVLDRVGRDWRASLPKTPVRGPQVR
ncbi:MAG: crossover junction endodeoxyribonuclease RuvC [Elusimicrobia bacterium]|nr:crossover junction endodeoxyribonuclease RuvC [Elusimicrobiota bacterium]